MAAIGVGLLWWGYWWGLAGVSLVKGWNNNVLQMANPLSSATFTKACYTGSGVWPTGKSGDSGACGNGGGTGTTNVKKGTVAGPLRKIVGVQKNGSPGIGAGYHGA